jgi:hypothetical protein
MKSSTCKGSNGQYLEEYHSEAAAFIASERIQKEFGHLLIPNVCRACGYWHLVSAGKTNLCMYCTDSALFQKDLYATRHEAEATARKIGREKKIKLFPYKCPYSSGWHLTHAETGKQKRR